MKLPEELAVGALVLALGGLAMIAGAWARIGLGFCASAAVLAVLALCANWRARR